MYYGLILVAVGRLADVFKEALIARSRTSEKSRGNTIRYGAGTPQFAESLRAARAEVVAYGNDTESQVKAMFGWTVPKMPAHYIARANREKLGISGMETLVAFDQTPPTR